MITLLGVSLIALGLWLLYEHKTAQFPKREPVGSEAYAKYREEFFKGLAEAFHLWVAKLLVIGGATLLTFAWLPSLGWLALIPWLLLLLFWSLWH